MKIFLLIQSLACVYSTLVNSFYPFLSEETREISSQDAEILMKTRSFIFQGSEILNLIPAISFSGWKTPNRAWIIIAGISDYHGQFKSFNEDAVQKVYKESNSHHIPLSSSGEITQLGKYQSLASEIHALRKINPLEFEDYVIVIKGLKEIPVDSKEYSIGLSLLEAEIVRFIEVNTIIKSV